MLLYNISKEENFGCQCLQDLPNMVAIKDADFSSVDAVFCCLPHGTTQVLTYFLDFYKLLDLQLKAPG